MLTCEKTNNRCIATLLQLYEEELINLKRDNNSIDLKVAQIAVLRAEMKALERECDFEFVLDMEKTNSASRPMQSMVLLPS